MTRTYIYSQKESALSRELQFAPRSAAVWPLGAALGNAEVYENRRDLVDHHQRHVVHLHQVARLHQQVAGAALDGRVDFAIAQVELGGRDGGRSEERRV